MSSRTWRRPPSRAWLKKYPQKSRSSMYQASSRPARPGYTTVPRSRGVYSTGEMKYFDTQLDDTPISQANTWAGSELAPNVGTPNTLVCPTVGSAINQRIGRKICLYKLRLKGSVLLNGSSATAAPLGPCKIRLALVQDMQTNSQQAQGEEIFATPLTVGAQYAVDQFQSLANLGRFKVWKDKVFVLQSGNAGSSTSSTSWIPKTERAFKMDLVFKKPIEISFNATNGGTISDIVDNSFCVYGQLGQTAATGISANVKYVARAYYKEL